MHRDPFAIHRQHMNRMLSGGFGYSPFLSITDGSMPGTRPASRRMQVNGGATDLRPEERLEGGCIKVLDFSCTRAGLASGQRGLENRFCDPLLRAWFGTVMS